MRLTITLPKSTRDQKALVAMRAIYAAKPGDEKRAVKRALKKLRKKRKAA